MRDVALPVEAIRRLADGPAARREMGGFYERLDEEIARRRPLCWLRGACCRFGTYGHRLYVTTLEMAWFLGGGKGMSLQSADDRCPYQIENCCGVRDLRPMGCRVFFCEEASGHWQAEVTERFQGELRGLHERLEAPYYYVDWAFALARLSAGPA
jgi:Fe-S-cluster containining protein